MCVPVSGARLVSMPSSAPQSPALGYLITDAHRNLLYSSESFHSTFYGICVLTTHTDMLSMDTDGHTYVCMHVYTHTQSLYTIHTCTHLHTHTRACTHTYTHTGDATIHILGVSIYHLFCITIQRYIVRYDIVCNS